MLKMKKIATLCTSKHTICIEDVGKESDKAQWIGDGYAMYRLGGIPYCKSESLLCLFDVDEEKRHKFRCPQNTITDFKHIVRDICDEDTPLRETQIEIKHKSRTITGLDGENGIVLVHPKYLAPLKDLDEVTLWERASNDGRSLIIAKEGMFTVAVIAPSKNIFENGAYELKRIAKALDELEVEEHEEYLEGQMSFMEEKE